MPKKAKAQQSVWRTLLRQSVIQYLAAGVIVFYADYLTFYVAYDHLYIHLALAQAIAYVVGVVVNFLMERYWVFKRFDKNESAQKESRRYAVILVVNYLITYAILKVLEQHGISPLWGKYFAAFFFTFWNYAVFRFWVFNGPKRRVRSKK